MSEAPRLSPLSDSLHDSFIRRISSQCHPAIPGTTGGRSRADWRRVLLREGWVAPDWPAAFGGTGWDPAQRWLFHHLTLGSGCPCINGTAIEQVAPLLIQDDAHDWTRALDEMLTLPSQDWALGWCRETASRSLLADVGSSTSTPLHALLLLFSEGSIQVGVVDLQDCRLVHTEHSADQQLFILEVARNTFQRKQLRPLQGLKELVQPLVSLGQPASARLRRKVQALHLAGYASPALTQLEINLIALEATERRRYHPDDWLPCHLRALELEAEGERLLQDALGYACLIDPDPAEGNRIPPHPLTAFRSPLAACQLRCAPGLPPQLVTDLLSGDRL